MRLGPCICLTFLALFGIAAAAEQANEPSVRPHARLSLSDMVGQMLVVGFVGTSEADPNVQAVARQIASRQIGGVLLLGRNISSPKQTERLTRYLHASADGAFVPVPFISVDQEGGAVQRLTIQKGFEDWLSAEDVAELNEQYGQSFAISYYGDRATSLAEAGINLNLGPVLDLNSNPANPIIGRLDRSYSENAEVVSTIGGDFVVAHRSAGIATSLKHFPGHGSSRSDSHSILPDVSASWRSDELLPYKSLTRRGLVDTVMMAHVYHPDFSDGSDIPSSMSRKAVDAARDIIGPTTVLISDDMHMGAVTNRYREVDAAIRAINAGVDVLIYSTFQRADPQIGPRLNKAIVDAVRRGDIAVEQIQRAYARIIKLKEQL